MGFSPALVGLWGSLAWGADAVTLEVRRTAQQGQSKPGLVIVAQRRAQSLAVRVDCDDGAWAQHDGAVAEGARIVLDLDVATGRHTCTGKLSGRFADGTEGEMPIQFEVEVLDPLKITVHKERVDLAARRLTVSLDRPAKQIEVSVRGLDGAELGQGVLPTPNTPPNTPIDVEWTQSEGEVLRIHVTGRDTHGFWSAVELYPWFYVIPHEDVVFETGASDIRPEEESKLQRAMTEVNTVLDKYRGASGLEVPIRLYVGGYTDTVGSREHNKRLSQRRATSIARWFRTAGFPGPIFSQGFGERGLAVHTPDEVDEAQNRRAMYILAAEAPPHSESIVGDDWAPVR